MTEPHTHTHTRTHAGLQGTVTMHSMYRVLLSRGEGGKGVMGAWIEHCCSANKAVDVLYDSFLLWFALGGTPTHTHTHTHTCTHTYTPLHS